LVNPNLASVLIFQLVDFTLQVSSEVGPEREAIFEPELDVCIGARGIAHGFRSLHCLIASSMALRIIGHSSGLMLILP
jgi:hypothetical protein